MYRLSLHIIFFASVFPTQVFAQNADSESLRPSFFISHPVEIHDSLNLSPQISKEIMDNYSNNNFNITDIIINSGDTDFDVKVLDSFVFGRSQPSEMEVGVDILRKRWLEGDKDAGLRIGAAYEMGIFGHGNSDQAFQYYLDAAQSENIFAMQSVGRAFLNGSGTPVDFSQASDWLNKSYKSGNTSAAIDLAQMAQNGWGTEIDLSVSENYWKEALNSESIDAYLGYANFLVTYRNQKLTDDNVRELVDLAALKGNSSAINLAYIIANRSGNAELIKQWFNSLANKASLGDSQSARYLGNILSDQNSEYFDLDQAYKLYRVAADDGDAVAQAKLGALLIARPDLDTSINRQSALKLVGNAAQRGAPEAFVTLASLAAESGDGFDAFSLATTAEEVGGSDFTDQVRELQFNTCAKGLVDSCKPIPIFFISNRQTNTVDGKLRLENRRSAEGTISSGISWATVPTKIIATSDEKSWVEFITSWLPNPFGGQEKSLPKDDSVITSYSAKLNNRNFIEKIKEIGLERGKRRIFVYIHGFANTYDAAATRLALFSEQFKYPGVPLLLSWASAGESAINLSSFEEFGRTGYANDQRVIISSCAQYRDILSDIIDVFGSENVIVLTHSMGAQLIDYILTGCPNDSVAWSENKKIHNLVMAAPDIDAEDFGMHVSAISSKVDHFTLYLSANDIALIISQRIGEVGRRRLGQGGPGRFLSEEVITIDATAVEKPTDNDPFMHAYIFEVSEVKRDLADLLRGEADPSARVCPEKFTDPVTSKPYWELEPRCTN